MTKRNKTQLIVLLGTDQVLRVPGIVDRDGTAQEDATVHVSLLSLAGAEIMTATQAAFAETVDVGPEPGAVYEVALPDTLDLAHGQSLQAKIEIVLSDAQTKRTTWVDARALRDEA